MSRSDMRPRVIGAALLALTLAMPVQAELREQAPPQRPAPVVTTALDSDLPRPAPRPLPLVAAPAPALDPAPAPLSSMPSPAALEAPPRVAPAAAATPRPAARPEAPAGRSSSGALAPRAVALRPAPRPGGLAPLPVAAAARGTAVAAPAAISALAVGQSRLPRLRPEAERRAFIQRAAAVRSQPPAAGTTGRATGQLCGVNGIDGHTIPPVIANVQGCGVAQPVRVRSVDGVRLSQSAILDCDTARALHAWVRTGLRPAVGRLGGGPAELQVAAHYNCRTRNHRAGAPISEHGRGRAIDISGVTLADGQQINILRHWRHATYGPVLRTAHRAACEVFTTTLGPGSDGMHEDHLHFDTRRGGRWCR